MHMNPITTRVSEFSVAWYSWNVNSGSFGLRFVINMPLHIGITTAFDGMDSPNLTPKSPSSLSPPKNWRSTHTHDCVPAMTTRPAINAILLQNADMNRLI